MPSRVALVRPKFGVRLLALLVDYAVILGWMALLALGTTLLSAITGEMFNWLELGTAGAQLLGFLLLVLPVGVYLFLGESSSRQATLGKRAFRLRVVDARNGDRPSRLRILVRTVVKLLPWEIAHFAVWNLIAIVADGGTEFPAWLMGVLIVADLLPIVYVAFVLLQKDRRGPHDLIAGTRVVSGEKSSSDRTGTPVA